VRGGAMAKKRLRLRLPLSKWLAAIMHRFDRFVAPSSAFA
jgi:hypothetical protein